MDKKQRGIGGRILSFALYIAAGIVIAVIDRMYLLDFVYIAVYMGMRDPGAITIFFYAVIFLFIYIGMMLQVVIHESGHLVFGLLTGYRFLSFRILSFMWVKTEEGMQFRRMSLAGTGGQCLMSPPDLAGGKLPVLWYNLGGVIMNTVFSAVFWLLGAAVFEHSLLSMFLKITAVMGIVLALTNGIPMSTGAVNNDGKNALSLSKDSEAMRGLWIQLKVNEETVNGVRIKDMPSEWFEVPSDEAMKNGMIAPIGVLAANRLTDERRFGEMKELTEHLLSVGSGIAGIHRTLLVCDLIYAELIGENRAEETDALLTKDQKRMMKAMKTSITVLRTEYALALLREGDEAKAEKALKRFEKTAETYPYPVELTGERELMETARKKFEEK